jgi:hypothetical protein
LDHFNEWELFFLRRDKGLLLLEERNLPRPSTHFSSLLTLLPAAVVGVPLPFILNSLSPPTTAVVRPSRAEAFGLRVGISGLGLGIVNE